MVTSPGREKINICNTVICLLLKLFIFYLKVGRNEGNVLFNDALNTFTVIWHRTYSGKGVALGSKYISWINVLVIVGARCSSWCDGSSDRSFMEWIH